MKQHDFELKLMRLWTTTRVPLTRANLLAYTKAERARMEPWLDEMVRSGILEVDSDDEGELLWVVRGAKRPQKGLENVGAAERLEQISREVAIEPRRSDAKRAAGAQLAKPEKSLAASGILSFFFGPLGWLYAGPMKEAVPAAIVWMVLMCIPFLRVWVASIALPLSAIAGLLYAWSYNRNGRRMPLLMSEDEPPKLGKSR